MGESSWFFMNLPKFTPVLEKNGSISIVRGEWEMYRYRGKNHVPCQLLMWDPGNINLVIYLRAAMFVSHTFI